MACYNISEILLSVINYVAIVIYVMVLDGCLILLYTDSSWKVFESFQNQRVVVVAFFKNSK